MKMSIRLKCKVKGIENLEKKINKTIKELPKKVEEALKKYKNIQ